MIPKFRAWEESAEEDLQMWSWKEMCEIGLGQLFNNPKYELMQNTGLKDTNGVEIYEGDIVRYTWDLPNDVNATEKGKKNRVSKVFWSDWRASFAVGKKSANSDLFRYVRNGNTVEIIGNIYENPELLEVAE